MSLKVTNNAFGTLNAGISNSDVTIVLEAGQGARFPVLGAGDYFYATLIDTSNNLEIVKVTARATDTMTVERAQDGTSARAYNVNDRFELRPTAALFNEKADAADLELKQDAATAVTRTSATGAALIPVGTTAQRPASPAAGMIRQNTTTGEPEWYDSVSGQWILFRNAPTYSVEYLVVAGGGGGGTGGLSFGNGSGGGGGGGVLTGFTTVLAGSANTVTIGAGGASTANAMNTRANNGANSSFVASTSITATGGGGGTNTSDTTNLVAGSGGSGGGGGRGPANGANPGGSGTLGQGNAGGIGNHTSGVCSCGGGGGGAGAVGGNAATNVNGNGGIGVASSISGASVFYAGGGGGTGDQGSSTSGGSGGGGAGIRNGAGVSGSVNTGGGGGGGNNNPGGNGGSGIVIIRYAGPQRGTGGTVTSAGGFTIHTFTSSGTFTA